MRALKKRDLLPEVAAKNNVDPEVAEKVVNFYWKEVIVSIRELKHLNILLHEIGEMRIVRTRLEQIIENMRGYLEKHSPESPQHISVSAKIEKLTNLLKLREEEYQKRENVREKRKIYEKTKKSVEVENEDS